MRRADGFYSRLIAWLKILLPLAALGLLSTIFLLARVNDPSERVPFADALSEGETAQEQVRAPYYAGVTENGAMLTMTARTARQVADDDGAVEADVFDATMTMTDGSRIELDAARAFLREGEQSARLEGDVRIVSSTGYDLRTETLVTRIDRIEAESAGPVEGEGPAGRFTAGKLRITSEGGEDDVQLLFTDGVKLVYEPQRN